MNTRRAVIGRLIASGARCGTAANMLVWTARISDPDRSASLCRLRRGAGPISSRGWCSHYMQTLLGQSVIVENRAGAARPDWYWRGGESDPDGHTVLVSTESSLVIAPHIGQAIGYDPLKDFAPSHCSRATPSCWSCTHRCRRKRYRSSWLWPAPNLGNCSMRRRASAAPIIWPARVSTA